MRVESTAMLNPGGCLVDVQDNLVEKKLSQGWQIYEGPASLDPRSIWPFFNIHKGEPVWVIGAGTSIKKRHMDYIEHIGAITIGVNQSYRIYAPDVYPFTYQIHTDINFGVDAEKKGTFQALLNKGTKILIPKQSPVNRSGAPYHYFGYPDPKEAPRLFLVDFTEGEDINFRRGYTAAFAAIQFAYFTGANPIILNGLDFCVGPRDRLHFYDDKPLNERQKEIWDKKRFLAKWFHLEAQALPALRRNKTIVINVSPISIIETALKVSIGQVFNWFYGGSYADYAKQHPL